jgi:hypothetical protein
VSFVFFLPSFLSYGDFLKLNSHYLSSSSSLFYMFQRFFLHLLICFVFIKLDLVNNFFIKIPIYFFVMLCSYHQVLVQLILITK